MDHEAPPTPGRVVARLARQVELALTTVDLTLPQYRVLGILDRGPEASSVLAEKLAVSRPSVTGVVDGLVARGLARRTRDQVLLIRAARGIGVSSGNTGAATTYRPWSRRRAGTEAGAGVHGEPVTEHDHREVTRWLAETPHRFRVWDG